MAGEMLVCLVDDDEAVLDSLGVLLETEGFAVETFTDAGKLLAKVPDAVRCIVSDVRMPEIDGLTLLRRLRERDRRVPTIMITAHGDVPMAVRAMQLGAVDFIEKPFDADLLARSIRRAIANAGASPDAVARQTLETRLGRLSVREREVFLELIRGRSNKEIARTLAISPRTVEIHRARVMEKMAASSLADLVRTGLVLGIDPTF